MSTITPNTPTERVAETATDDPPGAPSAADFEQLATNLMQSIDALIAAIPQFEIPHDSTRKFVHGHANIPLPFLATAVASVAQDTQLQSIGAYDLAEARQLLQLIYAFDPLNDKVRNFWEGLQYTIASYKATLAAGSLQVYAIAKALARAKKSASIGQLFENMQSALGRVRPKARKAVEVPVGSPGVMQ